METKKRVMGEEHPHTMASIANLAATYRNQVIETRKRVLGEERLSTLISTANLAFTWKAHSQDTKAVNLIQECIRLRSRILGVDHPDTLSFCAVLAKW